MIRPLLVSLLAFLRSRLVSGADEAPSARWPSRLTTYPSPTQVAHPTSCPKRGGRQQRFCVPSKNIEAPAIGFVNESRLHAPRRDRSAHRFVAAVGGCRDDVGQSHLLT